MQFSKADTKKGISPVLWLLKSLCFPDQLELCVVPTHNLYCQRGESSFFHCTSLGLRLRSSSLKWLWPAVHLFLKRTAPSTDLTWDNSVLQDLLFGGRKCFSWKPPGGRENGPVPAAEAILWAGEFRLESEMDASFERLFISCKPLI